MCTLEWAVWADTPLEGITPWEHEILDIPDMEI